MDANTIKCTQCSKSFDKKAKLTVHMKIVHSGIKYDCDFCKKQYGSKQGLTAHKKTIHKEELHNSGIRDIDDKVDITVSPNNDIATSLLKTKASSAKTDDQVNNAKKSNVAKKVPVHMDDRKTSENIILSKEKGEKSAKKDPKIKEKQKLSSKVSENGLKKETVSLISNLKNDNEFYVNDKQDKIMEKEILNKVNPKITFDFTPFESQNRMKIKAAGDVSKENISHLLKDQPNHVKFTSFASDCQINHEDCQDKYFDKPDEMVQTEVEVDDKESCVWAHCDNMFVDEELEFTKASAVNTQSHFEVGFNASSDKPSHSTEPQNVTQNSGISLESLLVPKEDKKTDISLETTPEVDNIVVGEFICETTGCKKKFKAKGDLDEHMRTADGQNRKCPLCLKDFFNEECRKYHKDQNCGVDTESDEEGDEDDEDSDSDFDVEAEGEEDDILDGPDHEMEGLKSEPEKVKDMGIEHNNWDVYDNVKETDADKQIVLKPLDQRKPDELVWNENEIKDDFDKDKTDKVRNDTLDKVESNSKLLVNDGVQYFTKNAIPTVITDAQHSTIDGIQMTNKDVSRSTNALIQCSPSYVQPKSDSQALTQYAQHPTKEGIQPLTKYAQNPSKDTIETQQNNVQYPTKNSTQMPTNDVVQRHTINVNKKPANDIKHPTKNGNQGLANDDLQHPSGTNILQNTDSTTDQSQNIRPGVEVEDCNMGQKNKAPKEKTLSLKEKQLLYRYHQQWKQSPYFKPIPFSPEQLIQMSQEHFENISANFIPPQLQFCKTVRQMFLKLPSKPAPGNFLEENQPADNSMQNKTIPKPMLKRKGELVNNEPMSKKIHLESKAVKEEDEDPKFKFLESVSKGLNLGNNKENYEVIIEDGKVKLRIIGNHKSSSQSLDEDNDKGSGPDNSKWKTYSDCKKDRSFSNGGPAISEGWKMYFEEQIMEGRKVMVAKYIDPEGKFYNRGPNGYDEIPNFQK